VDVARVMHIGAGALALAVFWIPMVASKGGRLHRRAGWTYSIAMWVAAVSAWQICIVRLSDAKPGNDGGAYFLAFVGLLVANGAATGIRVLRTKSRRDGHRNAFDLGSSTLLLLASLAMIGIGAAQGSPLFLAFAALGTFLSVGQLRYWLKPPASKREWWFEHMGNMLTACIGTVTAFVVVNVPRLGLDEYALFFWLAPGVLGAIGIVVWQRYYRRKLGAQSALSARGDTRGPTLRAPR
jgi:uncharacterized membrane protein